MKILTNTRCSDMTNAIIYYDSHDYHNEWKKTYNMPRWMQINEWQALLKNNPVSDVLFFPKPKRWFDERKEAETWNCKEVREINFRYKNSRKIGLHCFLWSYNGIKEALPMIREQGFDFIQVTPVQGVKDNYGEWWKYYQPVDIRFVDNPMGTRKEFKDMCSETKKCKIKVVVDVIFRHVAGRNDGSDNPHEAVDEIVKQFILKKDKCANWKDRWQYTNLRLDAPMCNIWNWEYQRICINFIEDLISLGADGLRIDQLKHYPVYKEGCDFLANVISPFDGDSLYIYGECIDTPVWENDLYLKY